MNMHKLFPGYYELTDEQLSELWAECIFVFDTNILLHIYRYKPETRKRFFFEILEGLSTRIWIPYQVAHEFQKQRLTVMKDEAKAYDEVIDLLSKTSSDLKKALNKYNERHTFIEPSQLTSNIEQAITETKQTLSNAKRQHPDLKKVDTFRDKIDELFDGKIGKPYNEAELIEKYQEAERRFEWNIPPGSEDVEKKSIQRYGDVILWFQILDYASTEKKPIIFITDDVKEDWWLLATQSHSPIRPHPELVQEMYLKADVLFHMYEGYKFVERAQTFLQLENQPAIIDEIKTIGQLTSQRDQEIQTVFEMLEATKIPDMLAMVERMEAMNVSDMRTLFEQVEATSMPDIQAMVEQVEATSMPDIQVLRAIFNQLAVLKVSDMQPTLQAMKAFNLPNMRAVFEALSHPDVLAAFKPLNLPDVQPAIEAFNTPTMKEALEAVGFPNIQTVFEAISILIKSHTPAQVVEANNQSEPSNSTEDNKSS